MKNFTINERQEIYEQLLTLGCDDLLAALLAERADAIYIFDMGRNVTKHEIQSWIVDGFDWFLTTEGHDFWDNIHNCVCDFEGEDYFDHGGGSTLEDYESPTELDFAPIGVEPAKIEIQLQQRITEAVQNDYQAFKGEMEEELLKPSFIDKVKLFFGKLFYRV